jgi:hypothetical protein
MMLHLYIEGVFLRDCVEDNEKTKEIKQEKKDMILCICGNEANSEIFIISTINKTEIGYNFQRFGTQTFCSDICLQNTISKFNFTDRFKFKDNLNFKNKIINLV